MTKLTITRLARHQIIVEADGLRASLAIHADGSSAKLIDDRDGGAVGDLSIPSPADAVRAFRNYARMIRQGSARGYVTRIIEDEAAAGKAHRASEGRSFNALFA